MDEKTTAVAFNPRTVQQALHALKGMERGPEVETLSRDLQQLAQTLAELGSRASTDVSPKRALGITTGPACAVLRRAAKLLSEKQFDHPDVAKALELQANAIGKFAGSE